jgi:hypothetical protein
MSAILWQESWTLGIDLIDAEHRSLVEGVNQLAACFTSDHPMPGSPWGWRAVMPPLTPWPPTPLS